MWRLHLLRSEVALASGIKRIAGMSIAVGSRNEHTRSVRYKIDTIRDRSP